MHVPENDRSVQFVNREKGANMGKNRVVKQNQVTKKGSLIQDINTKKTSHNIYK